MEVKLNLGYNQIISIIKQLPAKDIAKIKNELNAISSEPETAKSSLQNLLLSGPLMDDKQLETFIETRESLNKWRTK